MKRKNRYDELLFIAETCQASTMAAQFYSPDVLAVGSSGKGENSLSHHNDDAIGLSVIDRFTFYTLEFMEAIGAGADAGRAGTADAWFRSLTKGKVRSTAEPIVKNYARDLRSVRVTDFFGSVTEARPAAVGPGAPLGPRRRGAADGDAEGGDAPVVGYAEARESYRPVEEVLHASDRSIVRRKANDDETRPFSTLPAGRVAAYVSCVAFVPAVLAASRARWKSTSDGKKTFFVFRRRELLHSYVDVANYLGEPSVAHRVVPRWSRFWMMPKGIASLEGNTTCCAYRTRARVPACTRVVSPLSPLKVVFRVLVLRAREGEIREQVPGPPRDRRRPARAAAAFSRFSDGLGGVVLRVCRRSRRFGVRGENGAFGGTNRDQPV